MRREPFFHWLLTMVTFGQYGFIWGFLIARDTNELIGGHALDVKKHARVFSIGYALYMLAGISFAVAGWSEDAPSPLTESVFWYVYAFAIGLTGYFLWMLVRVAQMLRSISGLNVPRSGVVVILFFLWAISLPLLQSHLNKHMKKKLNQLTTDNSGASPLRV